MPVKILYHGHSNIEIHTGTHKIQIDPFYSGNSLADVPAEKANPTHILLTHAHSDHVGDAVAIARPPQPAPRMTTRGFLPDSFNRADTRSFSLCL